ncbi:MAG: MarR family transcriptional regulator [Thiogranum sp.]|nr:MarR family transcriptional regulator [Thiogranum sp.]
MPRFPLEQFLKNARALEKRVALALAESALNLSQYRLLSEFAGGGSLTASELSVRLKLAKPTVTHLLKQLQTMGVIEVRTDPRDQRSKKLALTRHGKLRLKIANDALSALAGRLAKEVSAEQMKLLQQLELSATDSANHNVPP